MESRTLANVLNPDQSTQGGQIEQMGLNRNFNTFLIVYSIQLAHRFPDVTELNSIEVNKIKSVAKFSIPCTDIALSTWEEYEQRTSKLQGQFKRSA